MVKTPVSKTEVLKLKSQLRHKFLPLFDIKIFRVIFEKILSFLCELPLILMVEEEGEKFGIVKTSDRVQPRRPRTALFILWYTWGWPDF